MNILFCYVHCKLVPSSLQFVTSEFWQGEGSLTWPEVADTAVEVVSAVERLSHDTPGNDLHKHNLKMRQLEFNIKVMSTNQQILARFGFLQSNQ